jgi:hypothetical protein
MVVAEEIFIESSPPIAKHGAGAQNLASNCTISRTTISK